MLVVAMVENHGLAQAKQLPEIGEPCLWVDVPQKDKVRHLSTNTSVQTKLINIWGRLINM